MFTAKIETGNAAMLDAEHVADALREIAREVFHGGEFGRIRDANGNTVGEWSLQLEENAPAPLEVARRELQRILDNGDAIEPHDLAFAFETAARDEHPAGGSSPRVMTSDRAALLKRWHAGETGWPR